MSKRKDSILGVILLVLLGVVLLGGMKYLNCRQQLHEQQQEINALKTTAEHSKKSKEETVETSTSSEKEATESSSDSTKTDAVLVQTTQRFTTDVTKVFERLATYDPDTYKDRKEQVKGLLSDDLMQQYFSDTQTVEDGNDTTSNSLSVHVYQQVSNTPSEEIKGLVVQRYESATGNNAFAKALTVYELSYDVSHHQVTQIQSLGSGYPSDLLDE